MILNQRKSNCFLFLIFEMLRFSKEMKQQHFKCVFPISFSFPLNKHCKWSVASMNNALIIYITESVMLMMMVIVDAFGVMLCYVMLCYILLLTSKLDISLLQPIVCHSKWCHCNAKNTFFKHSRVLYE